MGILRLDIQNVRGIRSLVLTPNGRNLVIWGPNGSGKSAVVDAIDFLLTGRVTRLTGKGTAGLSLVKHGPHIDSTPDIATVTALLEIPGVDRPVEIKRCIACPDVLECEEEIMPKLQPVLEVAGRGQHVLSRREILRFITAEAATRAEEIQALLDLSEIEEIRKALVRVRNDSDKDLDASVKALEAAKTAVNVTLQCKTFDPRAVSDTANRERAVLGGVPILAIKSSLLKSDLSLPKSAMGDQSINVTILEKDFTNLADLLAESNQSKLAEADRSLRALVESMRADPQALMALTRLRLIELGISLIDEGGACPLCEMPWPSGDLAMRLQKRLEVARISSEVSKKISGFSSTIGMQLAGATTSLEKVTASLKMASLEKYLAPLSLWINNIRTLKDALSDPLAKYPQPHLTPENVKCLVAPDQALSILEAARADLKAKYPKATPEQTAWDTLTRLEENLKALELASTSHSRSVLVQLRANFLLDAFVSARDEILGKLYEDIAERFTELYQELHGADEKDFTAAIRPEGPALRLEVDFYGRGAHPPHALHSEGHQDSMGVCLYLALAERLTKGRINLTILDDVVMSVDANHRRQVCSLIANHFPQRQFLITTHDKAWAHQLRQEGIVTSEGSVEFYNWSIATGPHVNLEADMWARIKDNLRRGDVSGAASFLRRGSEEYFAHVCEALEAQVKYRLDGRNDLGDYLPSAMGRYRSLLKKAKAATKSWSSQDQYEELNELESVVSSVFQRSNAEQWAVNASVHFNNWETLSVNDFEPVAEAFEDLFAVFSCQQCVSLLHLAKEGYNPVAVRCNCGAVNWNLVERS